MRYSELIKKYTVTTHDLDFILTTRCNKKCYYCDFPDLIDAKDININDLYELDHIFDFVINYMIYNNVLKNIGFIGGEIGLLSTEILNHIYELLISAINKYGDIIPEFYLATNGLLCNSDKRFLDIENLVIYYHITDDELNNFKPISNNKCKIRYQIVVTDDNYDIACNINEKYKNESIKLNNCYSIRNGCEACNKIDSHRIFNWQKCTDKSFFSNIDLVEKKIHKCCRSYTRFETVDLNINNIINMFNGKLFEPSELCINCEWN